MIIVKYLWSQIINYCRCKNCFVWSPHRFCWIQGVISWIHLENLGETWNIQLLHPGGYRNSMSLLEISVSSLTNYKQYIFMANSPWFSVRILKGAIAPHSFIWVRFSIADCLLQSSIVKVFHWLFYLSSKHFSHCLFHHWPLVPIKKAFRNIVLLESCTNM